jgi:flagellar L-ring protein precursor FlgH
MKIFSGGRKILGVLGMLALCLGVAFAKPPKEKKSVDQASLERYIRQYTPLPAQGSAASLGSLWSPEAAFLDPVGDYKAHKLGDPVQIHVIESTTSSQSGTVDNSRSYSATTAITGLAGATSTSNLNPLFSGGSSTALKGSGKADSSSTLNTYLAGEVAAVLPNGTLVVEAKRSILINNEKQTVVVRGMVRPADIGAGNIVASTSLANLEIEVKGKGIISDNTRRENPAVRWLMKIIGF